jgi:hypothetical protein
MNFFFALETNLSLLSLTLTHYTPLLTLSHSRTHCPLTPTHLPTLFSHPRKSERREKSERESHPPFFLAATIINGCHFSFCSSSPFQDQLQWPCKGFHVLCSFSREYQISRCLIIIFCKQFPSRGGVLCIIQRKSVEGKEV